MSTTIEDLLNASDSDEDLETNNVDLENLLNDGSDESDEDVDPFIGNRTSGQVKKFTLDDILGRNEYPVTTLSAQLPDERRVEKSASMSQVGSSVSLVLSGAGSDSDDEDLTAQLQHDAAPAERATPSGEALLPDHIGLLGALDMARRREYRNVMSGNRDVVSALHAKLISEGSTPALSHIKATELEAVSSQLRRNAQYKQHGPGIATVLYVHLKFIAIGTSRGLILLFDHFQEIRQVIGSNSNTAAQTVKTNAGVTAIDSTPVADVMIAGYDNGEVLLWDVPKGVILKRLSELHRQRVIRLKLITPIGDGSNSGAVGTNSSAGMVGNLLSNTHSVTSSADISAITVDTEGVVHRAKFSKMIWTSYTIDADCLLDGKTGSVFDLAVLSPVPSLLRYTGAAHALAAMRTYGKGKKHKSGNIEPPALAMFPLRPHTEWCALSTRSKTYVVQVYPEIKILHRWSPPTDHVDSLGPAVIALDWLWYPVDASAAGVAKRAKIDKLLEKIDSEESQEGGDSFEQNDTDTADNSVIVYPILVRTWGATIQLMTCFPLPSTESCDAHDHVDDGTGSGSKSHINVNANQPVDEVGFFEIASRTLEENIMAAKWLAVDTMKLVLLTSTHMLVIDATRVDLEIIERMPLLSNIISAISDGLPKNRDEGLLTIGCSSNDSFFFLTSSELYNFTLQSWVEQVDIMIKEGKWLDALAKVLQETKIKTNTGSNYLESSKFVNEQLYLMDPEEEYLDAKSQKENETIDSFLKRYLSIAINKQQSGSCISGSTSLGLSGGNAMRNQYHLVAGVCIEYCVSANRLRYLFSDVFAVFVNARQDSHFLDALEPFILNRRVRWLPPKIIGSLFEMAARSHRLSALERLIVHLDLSYNVDIHFVIKFLHEHQMSSAYLYAYASGLGDCAGAFHSLFTARLLRSEADGNAEIAKKAAISDTGNSDLVASACGYPNSEQAEVGYRLFLFLECVGKGVIFPREEVIQPPPSVDVLWRLLELLMSEKYLTHFSVSFGEKPINKPLFDLENEMYPYLFALFRVDANALFFIISESIKTISAPHSSLRIDSGAVEVNADSNRDHLSCSVAYILHHAFQFVMHLSEEYLVHYEVAQRPFFEQCLGAIVNCKEVLPNELLRSALQYINTHIKPRLLAEEMAAQLAQSQSKLLKPNAIQRTTADSSSDGCKNDVYPPLRAILEELRFYRSSLYICFWKHRNGSGARAFGSGLRYYLIMTMRSGGNARESSTVPSQRDALSGIDSDDIGEGLLNTFGHASVLQKGQFGSQFEQPFLYIDDQFRVLYAEEEGASVISGYATVVIGALSELYDLDKERTRLLATTHLLSFVSELCVNLKKYPSLLFDVLFAMFVVASSTEIESAGDGVVSSGRRTSIIAVKTSEFNRRGSLINTSSSPGGLVTAGNAQSTNSCATYFSHANMLVFLKLVATLQPRSLYGVLCSTENYSLDDAIVLCRERRVFDASSFLLERVGDVSGALDVALNEFTNCCAKLSTDISLLLTRKAPGTTGNINVLKSTSELAYFKKAMGSALRTMENNENNLPANGSTSISSAQVPVTAPVRDSVVSGSGHATALELLELLIKLSSFSDAIYALNFSMRLCSTHSSKTNNSMWFKVLDHTLAERAKHQTDGQKPIAALTEEYVTDEVCSSFIGELMQYLMSRMLAIGGVNPQEIVRRITQEQAMRGSKFSEFKEVFIGMVESHSFELFMYETVVQLHEQDLSSLQKKRVVAKRSAYRIDPTRISTSSEEDSKDPELTSASTPASFVKYVRFL